MAGAPVGNDNAAKGARWREAILRALARNTGKSVDDGLDKAADKLVRLAIERGDKWAIDHIADRVDGKPKQTAVIEGNAEAPVSHTVKFIDGAPGTAEEAATSLETRAV